MFQRCLLLSLVFLVTPSNVHCVTRTNDDPYFQLIFHGLTSIIWSHDDNFDTHLSSLSASCSASLKYIHRGIHHDGRADAYKVYDASAKVSTGILKGTTAALGHYDGCLALEFDGGHGRGQYCTATVELHDPANSSAIGSLYYKRLPYLKAFDLSYGLCFPSSCSRDEIEKFVQSRITKYPFSLAEYKEFPLDFETPITCETLEETTFLYRLQHLSRAQIISLILITILPAIVGISTLLTLIGVKGRVNDFSAQETIRGLLEYEEPTNASIFVMEAGKVNINLLVEYNPVTRESNDLISDGRRYQILVICFLFHEEKLIFLFCRHFSSSLDYLVTQYYRLKNHDRSVLFSHLINGSV